MCRRLFVPAIAVILLAVCAPLLAAGMQHGGGTGKQGETQSIEEIEEVEPVEAPAELTATALLGRMHTAVVHFPIAWVILLLLVDAAALLTRRDDLARVGLPLLVLACLSFVPAALTGFLRAAAIGEDPAVRSLMVYHRNMNIGAGIACFITLGIRARFGGRRRPQAQRLCLLLVAGAAALLMVAGHLGGKMVFGPNYLPF